MIKSPPLANGEHRTNTKFTRHHLCPAPHWGLNIKLLGFHESVYSMKARHSLLLSPTILGTDLPILVSFLGPLMQAIKIRISEVGMETRVPSLHSSGKKPIIHIHRPCHLRPTQSPDFLDGFLDSGVTKPRTATPTDTRYHTENVNHSSGGTRYISVRNLPLPRFSSSRQKDIEHDDVAVLGYPAIR